MGTFFSRERFGKAQVLAGLLLLVFVAECSWLVAHERPGTILVTADELERVGQGAAQWHRQGIAGTPTIASSQKTPTLMSRERYDPDHSPLWYLIGSAPVASFGVSPDSWLWVWLTRAPYILFGVLLGASLWYVSRRLYGNAGGYIALSFYCFSPAVVRSSTLWLAPPDIACAWGTFGALFTAIAVSHTLYAPREVVLWNWRRIVLLGISLALAVGSQFSLALVLPVLLAFMLYLTPGRRSAAVVILSAASAVGLAMLFAAYFLHFGIFWRRSRYFGNTAPLPMALLFLTLRVASPHDPDAVFSLIGVVFLFVLVAGILADLLETTGRELIAAVLIGLIAANALWSLIELGRIG